MDINLKPPKNCGECNCKTQLLDIYFCNYPVDKAHEMLNFSAYRIDDLETRPDWCPLSKIIEKANNMSDENKRLFNQMCDGMKAMFELINKCRGNDMNINPNWMIYYYTYATPVIGMWRELYDRH